MPQKEEAKGLFRLVLKFSALSLGVILVILAFAAILVTGGILPMEMMILAVILAEAAGAFLGGMYSAKRAESHKLPTAMVTGLFIFLVLLIAGFLFAFPPSRHSLYILMASVFPSLFGGIFSKRQKRRR